LILRNVVIRFDVLDQLANSLVRLLWHKEYLDDKNKYWNDQIAEEEPFWPKLALGPLIDQAVYQKDGTGGIESPRKQSQDKA